MTDQLYLVCPGCEHTEQWCSSDGDAAAPACPACGSDRAYLHHAPALPDPTMEASYGLL